MTDPSQYFRGRTVQEQMNEVIGYVDVRSAEVAVNAIASDVAQVHQDMLDADADATAAAASAAAAAGTLANAVKKTGEASQSIAGDIAVAGDLTGGTVTVPTPVNNTDAANKKYVDDQDALDVKLAGNQTVADVKTFSSSPVVPTETTGAFSTKAANSTKVKNELDNYPLVLRTTGNQVISGTKQVSTGGVINFVTTQIQNRLSLTCNDLEQGVHSNSYVNLLTLRDVNGDEICSLRFQEDSTGTMSLICIFNDGTQHRITIATYTP